MEELKKRLLTKYNGIIEELEEVDNICKSTLAEATSKGNYTETDISLLFVFARDNSRRNQFAKTERDLINKY
jgi:hypothetical protein